MLVTVILSVAAFSTSIVSGVLGMAGGVALIGVMATVLEASTVVPLHGAVQLFSNGSRVALLWKSVVWQELWLFLGSLVLGVSVGAWFFRGLSFSWLEPAIGILVCAFVLWRRLAQHVHRGRVSAWVYVVMGFCVGALSLFIGATGPLSALIFRRDDWSPKQCVATMAIAQAAGHLLKIPAFFALGFDYTAYLPLLALLFLCAALGSWWGRKLLEVLPKEAFALIFDAILMVLGLFLIFSPLSR